MKSATKIFVGAILFLALGARTTFAQTGYDLFQQALVKERAEGNLEQAIQLYQRIVEEFATERVLAAKALVQVGQCYEKLGKSEARKAYERVLQDYGDQQEQVVVARQRLALLDAGRHQADTITVREFMRSTGTYSYSKISDPLIDATEVAISSDGQRFVYTDWMTGDLVVYDVSTEKARGLYDVNWFKSTEFFMAPVFSPDEKRIAYVNFSWTDEQQMIRLQVDAVGGGRRETVYESKGFGSNLYPTDWSSDGQNILALSQAPDLSSSLLTVNLETKTVQRLITLDWEGTVGLPEYSPDGRHIAYDSKKDGDRKIYLMSADGSQELVLIDSPGEEDSPIWSPDGRFIVYRSNRSGNWDLYLVPVEKGKKAGPEILVKGNIGEGSSLRRITAAGRLFYSEELSGGDIALIDRHEKAGRGVNFKLLPKVRTRHHQNAAFAPANQRMAYIAGQAMKGRGAQTLQIADFDGNVLKEISFAPEFRRLRQPAFSPDGKTIALIASNARSQNKILVVSAGEGKLLKVFSPLKGRGYIFTLGGWSPDSQVLYTWNTNNQTSERFLATINIQTDEIQSTVFPKNTSVHGVSPDGNFLLLRSGNLVPAPGEEYSVKLILRSLQNGQDRILAEGQFNSSVWDFDSRHIFYNKGKDEGRLYRFSVESGAEELFLEGLTGYALGSVSSDGRYLAFYNREQSDRRMWVLENFLPESKEQPARRRAAEGR